MAWYSTGTVAVTLNNNTVTGTGTAFDANCRVGDAFLGPDGAWYEVTNVASATVISIKPAYKGATGSGKTYSIAPIQGYVKSSADALRSYVNQYGTTLASLGPWSTSATPAEARTQLGLGPLAIWQSGQALQLPGTGVRIQAQFSGAAYADRCLFQNSAGNSETNIGAIPSGTGNRSAYTAWNSSDPANGGYGQLNCSASEVSITSARLGTASYLPFKIYTGGSESLSIDPNGYMVVGGVTRESIVAGGPGSFFGASGAAWYSVADNIVLYCARIGSAGSMVSFRYGTTAVGSISTNGSATAYNTTSDPRLKLDPEPIPDAPSVFDAIEWVRWHWKAAPELGWAHGVLAPQLKAVFPEAVVGEENAVDEDGNILPMGVDYSKLVPILGAALADTRQQLRDALERITALEQERQTA